MSLVLGHPWLQLHIPCTDWALGKFWPQSLLLTPCFIPQISPLNITTFERFQQGEGPVSTTPLPLCLCHQPTVGASLPSSCLYNLSRPEREAMKQHVSNALAAGIICQSSSPLWAGFFFKAKKDKSLHLCIDYRGLNKIIVKNKHLCH